MNLRKVIDNYDANGNHVIEQNHIGNYIQKVYDGINCLVEVRDALVEGVQGSGINEWLLLKSKTDKVVNGIEITNGYTKSEDLYYDNNRIKKVRIEFSDNSTIEKELEDEKENFQSINFDKAVNTSYIKIIVIEVYKGNKYDVTCISEVRIY